MVYTKRRWRWRCDASLYHIFKKSDVYSCHVCDLSFFQNNVWLLVLGMGKRLPKNAVILTKPPMAFTKKKCIERGDIRRDIQLSVHNIRHMRVIIGRLLLVVNERHPHYQVCVNMHCFPHDSSGWYPSTVTIRQHLSLLQYTTRIILYKRIYAITCENSNEQDSLNYQ